MLFIEPLFLFVLLPLALLVVGYLNAKRQFSLLIPIIILVSCIFYAVWSVGYLVMLVGVIFTNYVCCKYLIKQNGRGRKYLLMGLVTVHLLLLGVFKYTYFIAQNMGIELSFSLVLPLAISFYTFQQISFCVDVYRGDIKYPPMHHYLLYILFFPQLIAGPIVQFKDIQQQFIDLEKGKLNPQLALGCILFGIGFCKKVFIADMLLPSANTGFMYAEYMDVIPPMMAWVSVMSYALQLYFDFSGYADMAIGLGLMFGIVLPTNFNSPYLSANISDFWQRWHITLGRFLRDYLYIPIGGSKFRDVKTCRNLMIVMVLGGIWHGAGWGFLIWGLLHGTALVIYHSYKHAMADRTSISPLIQSILRPLAIFLTFSFVVLAWIPFRAETLQGAITLFNAIVSLELINMQEQLVQLANDYQINNVKALLFIAIGLIGVFMVPNSQQLSLRLLALFRGFSERLTQKNRWVTYSMYFIAGSSSIVLVKVYAATPVAAFLYFQF
jgi:D-alanyl-lipoteichoic acid acyltransferase DltB (MBOAT superfamily)